MSILRLLGVAVIAAAGGWAYHAPAAASLPEFVDEQEVPADRGVRAERLLQAGFQRDGNSFKIDRISMAELRRCVDGKLGQLKLIPNHPPLSPMVHAEVANGCFHLSYGFDIERWGEDSALEADDAFVKAHFWIY